MRLHMRVNLCVYSNMCVCYHVITSQGSSESSAGVVAHPGIDMAVWCLGAFLYSHGIHLHPPQLHAGTQTHTQSMGIIQ